MRMRKSNGDLIGDILLTMGVLTREQLMEAVSKQMAGDHRSLGVILMELRYATAREIEHALMRQRARRGDLEHSESIQLLQSAEQSTRRAASCMDELALAASELLDKAR